MLEEETAVCIEEELDKLLTEVQPNLQDVIKRSLSLDLKSMSLSLRCSLGEVNVRGLYSAFNENLYNLIPVMCEGHV
ncbi:unnamed protein product, partial [Leptidea sinapis]